MGREIRKVPAGWEHPKDTHGTYRPLFDASFDEAMREWVDEWEAWGRGERPSYYDASAYPDGISFVEWHGGPPNPDYYPDGSWGECTHFQMYETVSEGTPLSPVFAALGELADWLCTNQDYCGHGPRTREQADAFCQSGWAPSFIIEGGKITPGLEAIADLKGD